MATTTLDDVLAFIRTCDRPTRERMFQAMNLRARTEQAEKAQDFRVGDPVCFIAKGQQVFGTVAAVNRTTLKVSTNQGNWRISPSLVRKAA